MAFIDLAQGASTPMEHSLAIEDCMANLAMRYDDESKGVDHARWLREVLATLVYMSFHSVVRQGIKEDMKSVKDVDLTWQKIIDTVKRDQRYSAAVGATETAAQVRARRVEALNQDCQARECARCCSPGGVCGINLLALQCLYVCTQLVLWQLNPACTVTSPKTSGLPCTLTTPF